MSRVVKSLSVPSNPRNQSPPPPGPLAKRPGRGVRGILAWALLSLAAVLVGGGCGGDNLPPLHPVKGKVTLNNKAYTQGGTVTFHAKDTKNLPRGVPAPNGNIDAEGNYEIKTGEHVGAPQGTYMVTVAPSMTPVPGKKFELPFREVYGDPRKTPIVITVPNSMAGAYNVSLKK
jgi:hypothetical protein